MWVALALAPLIVGIVAEIFGVMFVPEARGWPYERREDVAEQGWWLKLTIARVIGIIGSCALGLVGLTLLLTGDVPA